MTRTVLKNVKKFPDGMGKMEENIKDVSSKNKPLKIMKTEFGEYWKLLIKKLAYAYGNFEMIEV